MQLGDLTRIIRAQVPEPAAPHWGREPSPKLVYTSRALHDPNLNQSCARASRPPIRAIPNLQLNGLCGGEPTRSRGAMTDAPQTDDKKKNKRCLSSRGKTKHSQTRAKLKR
ncbi:hypothetical protein RRG08_022416 [Elysia crispata]|uniref:Uncharacterized protein n=1 Tax=Elysia crispata TaxID=231223 RepID=A0AAE1D859_9GAST|nr:hypothetical protein RRG08_022416 [Elysia crispata]